MRLHCVHFTGIQHETCEAGIRYDDVRVVTPGEMHRWPCTGRDGECASRRYPTAEEMAEEERLWAETFAKVGTARKCIVAVTQGKRGVQGSTACPVCDGGTLHYSVAKLNGHILAACTTPECVRWME